jgi:S-(hydroxymethyl)glutathione dehydrogenase/alcohol dehydrogenase
MRAALQTAGGLTVVDGIELRAPEPGEVVVRLTAAGVCHSDLKVVTGTTQYALPVVLGHEGTGVVEEVGAEVTSVQAGDTVVVHTIRSCGRCAQCVAGRPTRCKASGPGLRTPFTLDGTPVHQFANTSVFVERTIVHERQVVAIDPAIAPTSAALLGCGVVTGVGAVRNRAKVAEGDTVAVIGAGGVGLNVVQGARLAKASSIVAVDANPAKEALARRVGATDVVIATGDDAVTGVLDLLPSGVDHAFVCIGIPELVPLAVAMLDWGGQCVVVGFPGPGVTAAVPLQAMYDDKAILACRFGTTDPPVDIPVLAAAHLAGELLLDELVTSTRPLGEVADAFADMAAGRTEGRTVLTTKEP